MDTSKPRPGTRRPLSVIAMVLLAGLAFLPGAPVARSAVRVYSAFVASRLRLQSPWGIAFDPRSNVLYVADNVANRVLKLSTSGRIVAAWSKIGVAPGVPNGPSEVAVDGAGNIYVEEADLGRIQKLSPIGKVLITWNHVIPAGQGVLGLAVDARGNMYLGGSTIVVTGVQKLSSTGTVAWRMSLHHSVSSIAVDSHGTVYASIKAGGTRIAKISPGGKLLSTLRPKVTLPTAMTIDASGNIYALENPPGIVKISPRGGVQSAWTGGTGQLTFGITVDPRGYIYVASRDVFTAKGSIHKLSPRGKVLATWQ